MPVGRANVGRLIGQLLDGLPMIDFVVGSSVWDFAGFVEIARRQNVVVEVGLKFVVEFERFVLAERSVEPEDEHQLFAVEYFVECFVGAVD